MITVEELIQKLEALHEDTGDQSLEVAVDMFKRMRRNISDRNTLYGYLSDDKWRDLEWWTRMSDTSIQEIRSLKVGRYIVIDGEPCKLVEYITSKPGKHGEAKARMVAIGLFDRQKRSLVHPVKNKVHLPLVDRRKAQILANMGAEIQMMDLEDYNTFNVPLADIPDKFHGNMEPGNEIVYLSAMGRILVTD